MPYKDPEKRRQNKQDRYEAIKNDPEFKAARKRYRDVNAEANREYQRIYKLTNAEQLRELRERRKHLWKSSAKAYQREYARQYAAKFKQQVIVMYGGKCVCCGDEHPEFLTIDHINGDGHIHRKSIPGGGGGHRLYRWLVGFGEKHSDYRLLCFNCNCSRGIHGYCPHESRKSLPEAGQEG